VDEQVPQVRKLTAQLIASLVSMWASQYRKYASDCAADCASDCASVYAWDALIRYHEMGKERKADHYQRLLLANPPTESSHGLLRGYFDALAAEYKKEAGVQDDWTMIWFNTVDDAQFEQAGHPPTQPLIPLQFI
jgi:hypothetical protein